ncbi:hypothetical protein QBC40DRAFT_328644 [Triangularia verruculosa]|uniref:Uncharacterized protein n=1 Tax=Triangularia verruculosa TaxID=2587418 RepID=A0AAN6XFB6_9PEZI|nr:hypothetical protein QBC40DRAFT_328644 [Triangularia verruculosa]
MVQRALSHRRTGNRTLEIDVASAATAPTTPSYITIPIRIPSVRGRSESSLPLSRHHLARRSDSVSTTTSSVSSSYKEAGRYLNREQMGESAILDDEFVKREGGMGPEAEGRC